MDKKNKNIYIVLTHTGTILSIIIRSLTGAEYSHVSLALDKKLDEMYSFGRLNPYNPFIGGFVHEGIYFGTFNRFKKTKAEIYPISVTEKQYKKIKQEIKNIEENKNKYSFNILGMALAGVNCKYRKSKSFYCAEFVKHLTDEAELDLNLPDIIRPIHFKTKTKLKSLYKGTLRNYN